MPTKAVFFLKHQNESLQHFAVHYTRQAFVNAVYDLVGSTSDEEFLRLMLNPSMTSMHIGSIDESWSTLPVKHILLPQSFDSPVGPSSLG